MMEELNKALEMNDHLKVLDICERYFESNKDGPRSEEYLQYAVTQSISLIQTGKIVEARDILSGLYQKGLRSLDVKFLLSHIYFVLGHYEGAVQFGAAYFEHLDKKDKNGMPVFTDAKDKGHEVCNNLGTLSLRLNKTEDAIVFFNKGLEYKQDYEVIYQNLGVTYSHLGKWDEAKEILERGAERCPEDAEIHRIMGIVQRALHFYSKSESELLNAVSLGSQEALYDIAAHCQIMGMYKEAKSWMDKYLYYNPDNSEGKEFVRAIKKLPYYRRKEPKISVCLIVKNEEEMLGKCLESVADAANEIVVVDTGSEDKTVEIAERFGARVYHHPWQNSFSEARNYSLSKATGDWILIIDADEVLERSDIPKIIEAKWQRKYNAVCFGVYSVLPGQIGGSNMGKNYSARLFKNRKSIYYEGIVHNVLRMPKKVATSDIRMYHFGYDLRPEKMQEKFERSLTLLLQQIEDDPNDAFARYNTAQMLLSRNYRKEAEEHAKKLVEIVGPDNIKQQHLYLMGLYQMSVIAFGDNRVEESEKYCNEALMTKDDYVDPMYMLMWIYFIDKRYEDAKAMCWRFINTINKIHSDENFNLLIVSKLGSDYTAYYILGEISRIEGDISGAKEYINKSLEHNEYYWKAYRLLGEILMSEENYKEASEVLEMGIKYGYMNAEKYGTIGAQREEYRGMLDSYRAALEKSAGV